MIEPQLRIERAVVVVPVHDEELLLDECLSALADATSAAGVDTEVVIVLDACTDSSPSIAHGWAREVGATVVTLNRRNVGAARAAGFRSSTSTPHSAALLAGESVTGAPHTWFATTDADSVVPEHWLSSQLEHAHRGAHVVAGTVSADFGAASADLKMAYDADYGVHLASGHNHVHGANLGMRAAAYWCVGGFADIATDEDVELIARFDEAAIDVLYADDAPVSTSTRRVGRAPGGFSRHIRALELTTTGPAAPRAAASGLAVAQ